MEGQAVAPGPGAAEDPLEKDPGAEEGEAETLAELNVARYHHACGQFVNDEGVTVRFIYRMYP